MKCVILHESAMKMRFRVPKYQLSIKEADAIEYYLRELEDVKEVTVYERTSDVTVTFRNNTAKGKDSVFKALETFDFEDEKVLELVPEETGRAMNRKYEEKLVMMVTRRVLKRLFLPVPIRTIITVFKSIPFIVTGLKALYEEGLTVSVLDAVAILASIVRGDFSTASSIIFLLRTGELLEEWTHKKSVGDLARSMSLKIDKVWVQTPTGDVQVSIHQVNVGDHVIVRTSEMIPLDGVVVEGEMYVNQSTMTGESEPVIKNAGSYVYAGTVVDEGECVIEVKKKTGTGKYDQIVNMIEESEKLKSQTEVKAYALADRLVPYSFKGSILTYIFTRDVNKALSFLMVDYSCAMKLSMPLSVLSAMREARIHDIAVKGGKFMEAIAKADTIVFDKTGTLTHATPKLAKVVTFGNFEEPEMLRIAACLEEHYPHSVATAIVKGASERGLYHDEMHSKVQYVVAHGVSSTINDKKVVIGSYHFVVEDENCKFTEDAEEKLKALSPDYSRIFLGIGGTVAAVLCISDPLRAEAGMVIDELHALGVKNVVMMTGDNKKTAKAIAAKLNLDDYHAEVLPEDKAAFIKSERAKGHTVIMIGDGVNDTPALSEADVGIAISEGAMIAREIADVTISSDSLLELVALKRISIALMDRIKSNYGFILTFNTTLIILGVLGILPPSSSALLHNTSTIITGLKSMTPLLPEDNAN